MEDRAPVGKRALRAEIRRRRNARGVEHARRAAEQIAEQLRGLVEQTRARTLACYLSGEFEPGTRPFLEWAGAEGLRILLPVTREDGLLDWVVSDGESEIVHELGFPETVGTLLGPIAVDEVDLMLVPAAAVDRSGMRLGWGRGYYDKTLGSMQRRPPVFAIVDDQEFVDEVPCESHDRPVDGVVTPSGVHRFPA